MKIKVGKLRNIIRETIGVIPGDDEVPVSDDEFIDIILSETEKMHENSLAEWLDITVAAFIGLAGIGITIGRAATVAKQLYDAIDNFRKDEVEAAANSLSDEVVERVQDISDDQKLAQMYSELGSMRGVATAEEVRSKSRQIKNYMKLKLSSTRSNAEEIRNSRQTRNY